jgi:putative ABC transport system permease protein
MRWMHKLPLRLRSLFRKVQADHELSTELQFHLQQQMDQYVAQGMAPQEARYAALRDLGGLEQIKEECREMREVNYIENVLQDLRFGWRQWWRAPGFTGVAVLTLALGIGANTAVFSVVDGVLLRPLPFPDAGRLTSITNSYPQGAFVAMQSNLRTMELTTYADEELNLTGMGEPVRLYGESVSAEFFSVLGARPALGATFQRGQDHPGKDSVIVLSQSLWQQKFNSDRNIIGRIITIEGVSRQVVGVMPADFRFSSPKIQFWIPLHLDPNDVGVYWGPFMPVFGRLRPGATFEQARAEAGTFIPRIRNMFPWKMPENLWPAITVTSLQESLVGDVRSKLLLLLGAIGLVLLIACANVANLLLARAATRQQEIAVRAALGASNGRIFRQLLTESVLLAVCGGIFGLLLAVKGLGLLEKILPADTPRMETIAINWRVLVFTAAIAILTGIIFGLAPAFHAVKLDLIESLKGRGRHAAAASQRLRGIFAVSEIALAFVLVIAAGLMVKSLWQLAHVDPGFRAESIATARITPSESFCMDFTRCTSFYNDLLDRAKRLPGVTSAALANVVPLNGRAADVPVKVENYVIPPGGANPMLWENISTPDYLRLMDIPLLQGRSFTEADGAANAQPVVLVSKATARRLWPGQDPIGKHLKPPWLPEWRTVVGLVGDVHEDQLTNRLPDYMAGEIYLPFGPGANLEPKHPPAQMTLLVRTANSELDLAGVLRPLLSNLSQEVPVTEIRTMPAIVSDSVSATRSTMSLFAVFAALALLLGGVGIYGVVSYSMAQRTSEIGLRMALGAQPRDVLGMVLREGARLALAGVAIGVVAALALTRLLTGLLYGVSTTDPLVFGGVSALFTLVAVAACYIPARRAMRVDPMVALRYE